MKIYYKCIILFILFISCAGCSPRRTICDSEIKEFNKGLTNTFSEIENVKTYIQRPSINWVIYLDDNSNMDDIFHFIVKYIKTSNIYEDKLKAEYTGIYSASRITITFYKAMKKLRTCEGYYRHRVVSADDAVNQNKIDNFNTWYISEENKKISVYEYKS